MAGEIASYALSHGHDLMCIFSGRWFEPGFEPTLANKRIRRGVGSLISGRLHHSIDVSTTFKLEFFVLIYLGSQCLDENFLLIQFNAVSR